MIHFTCFFFLAAACFATILPQALQNDIDGLCRRKEASETELRTFLQATCHKLHTNRLNLNFKILGSWYPLCIASSLNKAKVLLEVMSCTELTTIKSPQHWPLFYSVVRLRELERTRLLLEAGMSLWIRMDYPLNIVYMVCNPNVSDIDGQIGDQLEIIIREYRGQALVNVVIEEEGLSPLGLLLSSEVFFVPESLHRRLQVLLNAGADPLQPQPASGLTTLCMLIHAFSFEYVETLEIFLRLMFERLDVNYVFDDGSTIDELIAAHAPDYESVAACIDILEEARERQGLIKDAIMKKLILDGFCVNNMNSEFQDPCYSIIYLLQVLYIEDIEEFWHVDINSQD